MPPTVEEVNEYMNEKGYLNAGFTAEYFVNFYGSKGWKVGRDKMTNWKMALLGWVTRNKQNTQKPTQTFVNPYDALLNDLI